MKVTLPKAGKRGGAALLAVLCSIFVPLLMWVAFCATIWQIFVEWRTLRPQLLSGNLACGIDAGCPPGYVCVGGRCVPVSSQ